MTNNTEELADNLPRYYPKDKDTSNFKLLEVIGNRIDDVEQFIENLDNATNVQTADTNAQLKELGKNVNSVRREGESIEKYRARVISDHQLLTSEGTPMDVINSASIIMDTTPESIRYVEYQTEDTMILIGISSQDFDNTELSEKEVEQELNKVIPAGYTLTAFIRGTFEIANVMTYENNTHESSKAVSGLDEEGNPIEEYGTISSTI